MPAGALSAHGHWRRSACEEQHHHRPTLRLVRECALIGEPHLSGVVDILVDNVVGTKLFIGEVKLDCGGGGALGGMPAGGCTLDAAATPKATNNHHRDHCTLHSNRHYKKSKVKVYTISYPRTLEVCWN